MTTVLEDTPESIKAQNYQSILVGNVELADMLFSFSDTDQELTQSTAAMRVIFNLAGTQ